MANPIECPPESTMKELIQGKINEPQLSELSAHLESCGGCQEKVKTLGPFDTFSEPLRSDPGVAKKIAADIPRPLIEKVKNIARAKENTVGVSQQEPPSWVEAEPINIEFLAPPQQPDEIGRLGSYRILEVLGQGGMGMVFLGHDPHLDRSVALKVMLPKFAANEAAKQRFLREARTAAKLHHDHIVHIYQVGEDRGVPYLAMEFLEGASLDQFLHDGRKLSLPQILRIAREIAKGLAAAHEKGLIHRDIKPANIWLDKANAGRAKLLDFGLARSDKDDIHLTQSGAIVGTPAYMAPEQARGEKGVDARADLFSLGCVLYRLCAGDIPFKADTTMGILLAIAINQPTQPIQINAQIPQALSDLTMQLLDKDPGKRPASAKEVIARIQQIEKDLVAAKSEASQTQAVEPAPMAQPAAVASAHPVKRRRSPVQVAAMVFLVVLLVVGAGTWALMQMGVIRVSTPEGDFVVNTDDPNFKFSVSKGAVLLEDTKKGRTYEMKALRKADGEYELQLTDVVADLSFKVKTFTIKRGEQFALKATFEPKQVAVVNPPQPTPPADYALRFNNGADLVSVPTLGLAWTGPFTMEGYFKQTEIAAGNQAPLKLPKSASLNSATKSWCFDIQSHVLFNNSQSFRLDSHVAAGKTAHVAVVSDTKQVRLYVNGIMRDKLDIATKKNWRDKNLSYLQIGHEFNGVIDEVRISKIARYTADFTPAKRFEPDKATLALYHFDEGAGDVLKDSSGNDHHGKIVGAKWVKADGLPPPPGKTFTNSLGMEFALVPKGKSWLGGGNDKEGTEVNISQDFQLGVHLVTQEQWQKVMGNNPSHFTRDVVGAEVGDDELKRFPVETVDWADAQAFVKKLNELARMNGEPAGWEYRLPTEQQWEYACRGGPMADGSQSAFDFYFAKASKTLSKDQANFDLGVNRPSKVGSYPPNSLGLFDMHGNVWQWCEDLHNPDDPIRRVRRGGSWRFPMEYCAAANRFASLAADKVDDLGFRVARVPVGDKNGAPSVLR